MSSLCTVAPGGGCGENKGGRQHRATRRHDGLLHARKSLFGKGGQASGHSHLHMRASRARDAFWHGARWDCVSVGAAGGLMSGKTEKDKTIKDNNCSRGRSGATHTRTSESLPLHCIHGPAEITKRKARSGRTYHLDHHPCGLGRPVPQSWHSQQCPPLPASAGEKWIAGG